MKNPKFSLIFVTIIGILVISNFYFCYKLYFDNTVEQSNEISKKVIYNSYGFDGIEAGFLINAKSKKRLGYYSNFKDTISIWPFLKLKYFDAIEKEIPTMYLYKYLDTVSNFLLLDSVKYGRNSLDYINTDYATKDVFIKLEVPRKDTVDNYYISFPVFTSLGVDSFSQRIDDSIHKALIKRFIEDY
ncbi:MAG: hypothetical protein GXO88_03710 [Chlorobi bacterium]|nr:hypothetical protein [Chlorobiota bacterium]